MGERIINNGGVLIMGERIINNWGINKDGGLLIMGH